MSQMHRHHGRRYHTGGYNTTKRLNRECKDGNITTRCGWRCRKLELPSFELRKPLFFDRLGKGDNSSKVALYAGDLTPSSMEFDGASKPEEGFATQMHDFAFDTDSEVLERSLGNARQFENSGKALVGEASSGSTETSRGGEGILYGNRVGGSTSSSGLEGDRGNSLMSWQS